MTTDPKDAERLAEIRRRHPNAPTASDEGHYSVCDYCFLVGLVDHLTQERNSYKQASLDCHDALGKCAVERDDATRRVEALEAEVGRLREGIDFAHGWIAGLPREPSFEDKHAAQAALEMAREAATFERNLDAQLDHFEEAVAAAPPAADHTERAREDEHADLAHEIMCEAREACGVYHTTAAGKVRRALAAAERGRARETRGDNNPHSLSAGAKPQLAGAGDVEQSNGARESAKPSADNVERARELRERICDMLKSGEGCSSSELDQTIASALTAAERAGFNEGFKDANRRCAPGWEALNVALKMIRDAVEELGPTGAVPSRDVGPPNYARDAEDIITGIHRIADQAERAGAEKMRALDEATHGHLAIAIRLLRFLKQKERESAHGDGAELPWQSAADMLNAIDVDSLDALVARDAATDGEGENKG